MNLKNYLLSLNVDQLELKNLNEHFKPIETATQLEILIANELISVDWENKIIDLSELSFLAALKKKKQLGSFERNVPQYMKVEKVAINKPILVDKTKNE